MSLNHVCQYKKKRRTFIVVADIIHNNNLSENSCFQGLL